MDRANFMISPWIENPTDKKGLLPVPSVSGEQIYHFSCAIPFGEWSLVKWPSSRFLPLYFNSKTNQFDTPNQSPSPQAALNFPCITITTKEPLWSILPPLSAEYKLSWFFAWYSSKFTLVKPCRVVYRTKQIYTEYFSWSAGCLQTVLLAHLQAGHTLHLRVYAFQVDKTDFLPAVERSFKPAEYSLQRLTKFEDTR